MAMKRKTLIISIVMAISLLFICNAYALTTYAVIHLTLRVVPSLCMDLDDTSLQKGLEAEAFSEFKDSGLSVDKLDRGSTTVWRFTKTE